MKIQETLLLLGGMMALLLAGNCWTAEVPDRKPATTPKIELLKIPDQLPGDGQTGAVTGKVSGLSSYNGHRVVLYSKDTKTTWWVQPFADKPLTEIDANGEFSADIHGGTEYAALLVKETYKPEAKVLQLPKIGPEVLAHARKKPEKPAK